MANSSNRNAAHTLGREGGQGVKREGTTECKARVTFISTTSVVLASCTNLRTHDDFSGHLNMEESAGVLRYACECTDFLQLREGKDPEYGISQVRLGRGRVALCAPHTNR